MYDLRIRGCVVIAVVVALLSAGAWAMWRGGETEPEQDARLTAAAVKRGGISSIGEWFAALPRTTPEQIAFRCDLPISEARRFDRELRGSFAVSLVDELDAACERAA